MRAELSPRGCAELVSRARMGAEAGGCSWPWALSSLQGCQTFKASVFDSTSVQSRTRFHSHWTGNSDPLPAGLLTSGREGRTATSISSSVTSAISSIFLVKKLLITSSA